jgi:hypothetical protein
LDITVIAHRPVCNLAGVSMGGQNRNVDPSHSLGNLFNCFVLHIPVLRLYRHSSPRLFLHRTLIGYLLDILRARLARVGGADLSHNAGLPR